MLKVGSRGSIAAVMAVLAVAGTASASASASVKRAQRPAATTHLHFIVVMEGPTSSPYWALMNKGFQTASKELGVTTTYTGVPADDSNPLAERQLILDALAQHPNAIFADDDQSAAFNPAIKEVVAARIPTFIMDVGSQYVVPDGALAFVGPNSVQEAEIGGHLLTSKGCKTALEVTLLPGVATFSDQRAAGFREGFKGTIVKTQIPITDIDSATVIEGIVKADLLKDPSIDCTFSVGQLFAVPMVAAVDSLGARAARIRAGTLDVDGAILQDIKAGKLLFTIDSQPFSEGFLSVVAMTNYLRYGQVPPQQIGTGPAIINSSNVNLMIRLDKQGVQ